MYIKSTNLMLYGMIRCTSMHNVRSAGVSFSSKVHGTTRRTPQYCARGSMHTYSSALDEITIVRPDDWHLHVRDGPGLDSVVPLSAAQFGRAIIMPNLVPPVTNTAMALDYKNRILNAVPAEYSARFTPLMTLYLTDNTTPEEIYQAKEQGVVALKMYPAGATTNSDSGVTDWRKCIDAMKAMEEVCVYAIMFPCLIASFVIVSTYSRVILIPFGGNINADASRGVLPLPWWVRL